METKLQLRENERGPDESEAVRVHCYLDKFCGRGREKEGMGFRTRAKRREAEEPVNTWPTA